MCSWHPCGPPPAGEVAAVLLAVLVELLGDARGAADVHVVGEVPEMDQIA